MGWARAQRIGRDGAWASMLRASGAGAVSSIQTDAASGAGMGAERALGAGRALGVGAGATPERTPRPDVQTLVAPQQNGEKLALIYRLEYIVSKLRQGFELLLNKPVA
jgi:hypothetical protein